MPAMANPAPPVGFLPAAGRGLRFGSSSYYKELYPILFDRRDGAAPPQPRPVCELALRAIRAAGAERCAILVSADKGEFLRVVADGPGLGLALAYVVQSQPQGLPHAVRCAMPWLGGADVVFAMPDNIVLPPRALADVHQARLACGADLMLGVFPVDEPERLGPVELSPSGAVVRIHDKPGVRTWMNSWGVASWSARFTDFVADWDAQRDGAGSAERAIGHAFEAARVAGLGVGAVDFPGGQMHDIGTPHGLRAALRALAQPDVVDAMLGPGLTD